MLISLETLNSKYNLSINGILHFGAHLAEEYEIYTKLKINDIIWFEANPILANTLKDKFNNTSNKIYHELISNEDDKEMLFYITNNGQSSSMLKLARHSTYYPEIVVSNVISLKTKRFDTLANEEKIDINKYNFLNIDVQGAELLVIKGFGELLKNIDYIYTEVNTEYLYEGCALLEEIDEYLFQFGFDRVELKMTDKSWGDAFYIKKRRNTEIGIHFMPQEIDDFERVILQLEKSAQYLNSDDYVGISAGMNMSPSLFKWNESDIKKDIFIDKFMSLKNKCGWAKYINFDILDDDTIQGTMSHKRKLIRECPKYIDQFLFIDCDIWFHETTLKYLIDASKNVSNNFYVITPQTVKLWDWTWDCLTNEKFKDEKYGVEKIFNPNDILNQRIESIEVVALPEIFKFATGWFTLYSKSLWQLVDIPETFGHYGCEDTYCMMASSIYKSKGYDIQQYILNGIYIAENYLLKTNKYSDQMSIINKKEEFRKISETAIITKLNEIKNI